MRRILNDFHLARWIATGAAAWLLIAAADSTAKGPLDSVIEEGRKLFEFEFRAGMGAETGADGLGPMFNHVSCVACHKQGGVGGGGPVDVNAEMLSVVLPSLQRPKKSHHSDHLAPLRAIHPAFVTADGQLTPNVVLHRFSTEHRYDVLREQITGKKVPHLPTEHERQVLQRDLARAPLVNSKASPGLKLLLSQRNTPALFGSGVIDAISDETLHELANAQQRAGAVSGRVPPVENQKAGRFGWRGQTEHLRDFVLGACANELGLEVPGVSQPIALQQPDYRAPALDLTAQQCNMLVAFVGSLPTPKFARPVDEAKRKLVDEGHQLFKRVGCAQCHVEEVGPAKGLFSDLLLHDLGPGLADPVLAMPTPKQVSSVQQPLPSGGQSRGGYGGGFTPGRGVAKSRRESSGVDITRKLEPLPEDLSQEWRTAPLWGMADSAPYLHDGRAETVLEAIAWHGGEARRCTEEFFHLPAPDRMKVLEFLACLKAP